MKRVILFYFFSFACLFSLFGESSRNEPQMTVSIVTGYENDLSEEKTFFVRIYSLLYKNIKDILGIDNLTTHFEKLFDDEIALIRDEQRSVYGIRAWYKGKMAAFATLEPTVLEGHLFLRWGAMLPASTAIRAMIAQALDGFASQEFSAMNTLVVMVPKACTVQKYLLQGYGFVECDFTFDGYDPEIYICFKFGRPLMRTMVLEKGIDPNITAIGIKLCVEREETGYDEAIWKEIIQKNITCIRSCQKPSIKDEELLYQFSTLVEELYHLIKSDEAIIGYFSVYCGSNKGEEIQGEKKFDRTYRGILEYRDLDEIDPANVDKGSFVFEIIREEGCDDQVWNDSFGVVAGSMNMLQCCSNETQYSNMLQSGNIIRGLYLAAQMSDFIHGEIRFYGNDITK